MKSIFLSLVAFLSISAYALDIEVKMLAKGSAVISIDGKQRMMKEGATSPEGVTLISADGKKAVLDINGKKQTLELTRRIVSEFGSKDKKEYRIASGQGGHFKTMGFINGMAVNFLVDTGATAVSMNRNEAERLKINYRSGTVVNMNTANGIATGYLVILKTVSIGNITLNEVSAIVSSGDSPSEILLGNSYLSKVEMKFEQGVLVIKER